jgi:hypothetical protein
VKTGQLVLILFWSAYGLLGQPAPQPKLDATQAKSLSDLMCRQLPNVGTILEMIQTEMPGAPSVPLAQEPIVTDDVYDALLELGPYSVNCLVEKLLDSQWMPDPRSEPLLGTPMIGDVAYMILVDKGVPDLLPRLAHKPPNELRMDEYFIWPGLGNHRRFLYSAVRRWLIQHPDCCGAIPVVRLSEPAVWRFRMSEFDFARAQTKFAHLRLGMSPEQVLKIAGHADGSDRGADDTNHGNTTLLGICANDHNEKLAYIYFVERWADEIAKRDPLRDRYVIVFFSAIGKLTREFSNVAEIAPILPPPDYDSWSRVAWGAGATR